MIKKYKRHYRQPWNGYKDAMYMNLLFRYMAQHCTQPNVTKFEYQKQCSKKNALGTETYQNINLPDILYMKQPSHQEKIKWARKKQNQEKI